MRLAPLSRFVLDPQFRARTVRFLLGRPTPLASADRTVLETITSAHV